MGKADKNWDKVFIWVRQYMPYIAWIIVMPLDACVFNGHICRFGFRYWAPFMLLAIPSISFILTFRVKFLSLPRRTHPKRAAGKALSPQAPIAMYAIPCMPQQSSLSPVLAFYLAPGMAMLMGLLVIVLVAIRSRA